MKTVIPKLETIGINPISEKLYVKFTYEVLDNENGLIETHTIHKEYNSSMFNSFEIQQFVHEYCMQLQESLN